jgi:PAS domain S-box-containing protein
MLPSDNRTLYGYFGYLTIKSLNKMDILNIGAYIVLILLAARFFSLKRKLKNKDAELELTLNRISDAIISVDKDWRYTFLNDAALPTHPRGREETLGKRLWDVHPGLIGTIFWDMYQRSMETGTFMEIENYYAAMERWFLIKVYPSDTGLTIFYQDVTEGKNMKDNLIKSEENYRTLFYKSPLPSWLYNLENLRFVDVNEAAVRHYGFTRDEFLSMTIKDIRPEKELEMLAEDIAQVKEDIDKSRHGKWKHIKKNGDTIIVETTGYSLTDGERPLRIVVVNDVTQKETAEQQLLENQVKLREAQSIAHVGSWEADLVGNQSIWSDEVYKIFELNKSEAEPSLNLFLSFIHPEDRVKIQPFIEQTRGDAKESKINFRFTTSSGKKRYGYSEWRFKYDSDNNPTRLFGILQDVTERKSAEEKAILLENQVREQKIQEQKKISRAIIKAQDRQRNHIAQELHDNINQILFGAKFHLGIAGRKDDTFKTLIQIPVELITNAMHEIHLLCHNLVAPLKNIYLKEMIQDLIRKQNENVENPIKVNLTYLVPDEISDDFKLNIYRIIQELLSNIVKHAEAKNVDIAITIKGDFLYITVQDDGKGFDVQLRRTGLGISNITDRVVTFNGKIDIRSTLREGTKTNIVIPCADYRCLNG